jgi:hypothetical protein
MSPRLASMSSPPKLSIESACSAGGSAESDRSAVICWAPASTDICGSTVTTPRR